MSHVQQTKKSRAGRHTGSGAAINQAKHARHAVRSQRLRRLNQPLADVLVQAAIQSGHLERLKAALHEGQFDG